MRVVYCRKCNHFSFQSKTGNYCKDCKTPLVEAPVSVLEYNNMSINERYRLAYKLTNESEK